MHTIEKEIKYYKTFEVCKINKSYFTPSNILYWHATSSSQAFIAQRSTFAANNIQGCQTVKYFFLNTF